MQLLNGTSRNGSAVLELMVGAILIAAVSVGVYALQHPHVSAQQQITIALHQ